MNSIKLIKAAYAFWKESGEYLTGPAINYIRSRRFDSNQLSESELSFFNECIKKWDDQLKLESSVIDSSERNAIELEKVNQELLSANKKLVSALSETDRLRKAAEIDLEDAKGQLEIEIKKNKAVMVNRVVAYLAVFVAVTQILVLPIIIWATSNGDMLNAYVNNIMLLCGQVMTLIGAYIGAKQLSGNGGS